ncbi:unnamed protein product [Cuscuta campestris]|uniref:Uncharacterized protein n=1 Tax=Cuscuta campestris TaxID=132261 RepID=A0A484NQ73_9ASTE|nr:unnamed protein product [Cuscuta campestris]
MRLCLIQSTTLNIKEENEVIVIHSDADSDVAPVKENKVVIDLVDEEDCVIFIASDEGVSFSVKVCACIPSLSHSVRTATCIV